MLFLACDTVLFASSSAWIWIIVLALLLVDARVEGESLNKQQTDVIHDQEQLSACVTLFAQHLRK